MPFLPDYPAEAPTREALEALPGATLLEFGSPACGWCRRAQPLIESAIGALPAAGEALRHVKVADGRGRRLGREYGVKLWPTLVFLRDGREAARLVRPQDELEIRAALLSLV